MDGYWSEPTHNRGVVYYTTQSGPGRCQWTLEPTHTGGEGIRIMKVPDSDVWQDNGDFSFGYVPTDDGEFERWMDEHKPDWIVFTTNIELWRAIWEAARAHYSD